MALITAGRHRSAQLVSTSPGPVPAPGILTALAAALLLSGCAGSPSGPTPPGPDPPTLTCPADIETTADDGVSTPVTFDLPPVRGGTPPLTLSCSPVSGGDFPVGDTPVTCTVSDSAQRSASCQFRVRVISGLRLSRTTFLAFGDSITEGEMSTAWMTLTLVGPGFSYPAQLRRILRDRYSAQDIVVINEGLGGETTTRGRDRLPGVLAAHPDAEVLLLLQGVNAINIIPLSTQLANLRSMIRAGRAAGMDVLIATLTPLGADRAERHPETAERIVNLNTGIRALASQERIGPAVDLYAAFEGRDGLLSPDGLHPNEAGYLVIAETFAEEIQRRWETGGAPSPAFTAAVPGRRR